MAVELSWATLSSKTTKDTASEPAGRALQRAWPETSWAGLAPPVLHLTHCWPSEHGRLISSPHVSPQPPARPPKPSWQLSPSALLSTLPSSNSARDAGAGAAPQQASPGRVSTTGCDTPEQGAHGRTRARAGMRALTELLGAQGLVWPPHTHLVLATAMGRWVKGGGVSGLRPQRGLEA